MEFVFGFFVVLVGEGEYVILVGFLMIECWIWWGLLVGVEGIVVGVKFCI